MLNFHKILGVSRGSWHKKESTGLYDFRSFPILDVYRCRTTIEKATIDSRVSTFDTGMLVNAVTKSLKASKRIIIVITILTGSVINDV